MEMGPAVSLAPAFSQSSCVLGFLSLLRTPGDTGIHVRIALFKRGPTSFTVCRLLVMVAQIKTSEA